MSNPEAAAARARNAYLRILLEDLSAAMKEAQLSASWLCTEKNQKLLDEIDKALNG